jgi:hypothetical protein
MSDSSNALRARKYHKAYDLFRTVLAMKPKRKDKALRFHHIRRREKVEVDFTFARPPLEPSYLERPKLSPHSADSSRQIDDHRKLIATLQSEAEGCRLGISPSFQDGSLEPRRTAG